MGYSLGVRDSIMIAHSFKGAEFGPAQGVHGATYTVDCEFSSLNLVPGSNWVVDIGKALEVLSDVLSVYNYKNLDDLEEFKGQNTTTEFMCKVIHDKVSWRMKEHVTGDLKITLHESHKAWASYSGSIQST
mmetsp:Transcript_8591/g.38301  ORF Transcript_8591/g.38301 Transcript_8591/m.38301 type:complete len:131 (+) Transcript_8591:366-758(+)